MGGIAGGGSDCTTEALSGTAGGRGVVTIGTSDGIDTGVTAAGGGSDGIDAGVTAAGGGEVLTGTGVAGNPPVDEGMPLTEASMVFDGGR